MNLYCVAAFLAFRSSPFILAIRLLVFDQVQLYSTSGQSTASGQSPSFVAGHISGRRKPSAPSWGW